MSSDKGILDLTKSNILPIFQLPVPERIEQLENLTSNTSLFQSDEVVASVTVLLTATEGVLENLTVRNSDCHIINYSFQSILANYNISGSN